MERPREPNPLHRDPAGPESWSRDFAGRIASHPLGAFPASVLHRGCLVLADTVAAIAAGARQAEVRQLASRFSDPTGLATVIAGGIKARPDDAAFLNAIAGTAAEMDEGNYPAGFHPAIHALPAALATAEATGASGTALLDALILGYEGAARIGRASRLRPAIHSHGTFGTIGAAIATGRLRRFDAVRMHAAMMMAASLATATSRTSPMAGGTIRHVYAGVASRNGMLACDLAECGFEGQDDGIDIAFGQALGDTFNPSEAVRDWAGNWEIERNYFKFAASCKDTQGSLTALEALIERMPDGILDPDTIETIRVETFAGAAELSEPRPRSTIAARFSIPFVLATRLVRGSAGVDDFGTEALCDPRIANLAGRVHIAEDPAFTAKAPLSFTRMHLSLTSGSQPSIEVEGSFGDTDKPLDPVWHERKFALLTGGVWDAGLQVREQCMMIGDAPDIRSLTRALC